MNRIWCSKFNVWVIVKCLIDLFQAWRYFNTLIDWKAHAHRFALFNIRILSKNNYLDILNRGVIVSTKDLVCRWVASFILVFFLHKIVKHFETCTIHLHFHWLFPITQHVNKWVETFKWVFFRIEFLGDFCRLLNFRCFRFFFFLFFRFCILSGEKLILVSKTYKLIRMYCI